MKIRVGFGYDVHALVPNRALWLGGIRIEHTLGLLGHSDADVLIHAICDALLGALALGDIGHLFPDTDIKYKGIDSTLLLEEVLKKLETLEWKLVNADITIALQAPKLAPHIEAMRARLAGIAGLDISRISVKATTTERLGFVGRGEGCEVWAIVLLEKK